MPDQPMQTPEPKSCKLCVDAKYDNGETVKLQFENISPDIIPKIIRLVRDNRTTLCLPKRTKERDPMPKYKIPQSVYVELYSEMAEAILEDHQGDLIELRVTEENGDVHFTEEAQDIYMDYCNLVEAVLESVGIEGDG